MALNLEFDEYEDVVSFLLTNKGYLFSVGLDEIKESIKNNKNVAVVANLLVKNNVISIQIEKLDWVTHLEVSLKYFEKVEDYETCIEIKELINTI